MSENPSHIVHSLLLSAPKARRLDLAIASLLYPVRKEYLEVILPGQRQVAPVYFFHNQRGYDEFFFSPELAIFPPGRAGKPSPDPVPSFVSNAEYAWQVQEFVHRSIVTCAQGELTVVVSNGVQTWEERAPIDSRVQKERETCRLLALATLRVYIPDLLPLLDAEEQKDEQPRETTSAALAPTRMIQEMVLVPVLLPECLLEDGRCQYQAYDPRFGTWHFCKQEWEGDSEACCPDPCPGCGAYYCEQHFSPTKYTFLATKEERRIYGTVTVTKQVCLTCALLPGEEVKRLRATRLAINGEPDPCDLQTPSTSS